MPTYLSLYYSWNLFIIDIFDGLFNYSQGASLWIFALKSDFCFPYSNFSNMCIKHSDTS